jgi:hypothetical protein
MDIESKEYVTDITQSHIFIRPLLGYNCNFYSETCYNTHIDIDEYNVYMVYNNTKVPNIYKAKHEKNKEDLINNHSYRHTFSNDVFDIFAFTLTDNTEDFDRFLDSRFTLFTEGYKNQLRKFYMYDNEMLKIINDVISPSKGKIKEIADKYGVELKDVIEVKSKIELGKEVFNKALYEPNGYIYEHYNKQLNKTKLSNEEKH